MLKNFSKCSLIITVVLSLLTSCIIVDDTSTSTATGSAKHVIEGVDVAGIWTISDENGVDFYWELTDDGYLKYYQINEDGYAQIKDGTLYSNGYKWSLEMMGTYLIDENVIFYEGIKGATVLGAENNDRVKIHFLYDTDEIYTVERVKSIVSGEAPLDPLKNSVFMLRCEEGNIIIRFDSENHGHMKIVGTHWDQYSIREVDFNLSSLTGEGNLTTVAGDVFTLERVNDNTLTLSFVSGVGEITQAPISGGTLKRIYRSGGNTKIIYTSTDGEIVEPTVLSACDSKVQELSYINSYDNYGTIEFNGEVETLSISFAQDTLGTSNLKTFDGVTNVIELEDADVTIKNGDGTYVTLKNLIFCNCNKLKYADLDNIDTERITDLRSTFSCCTELQVVDVSEFDTSNTTNFGAMFHRCTSLKGDLNLNNFNFDKATRIIRMFDETSSLSSVEIENLNLSDKIETVFYCFYKSGVKSVKVGYDNTTSDNKNNLRFMFGQTKSSCTLYYKAKSDGNNWNQVTQDSYNLTLIPY